MEKPLILGRYRPLEVKGTGGSGTVEMAYDTRIQRKVAIKHIPLSQDTTGKPAGLDEARTAALLANPHIVQVYDFACEGDEAFLIMEYMDGGSLADILDDGGTLTPDEAAYVVKSVADALEYAHENQVLHLDVKPDNILIDHNGTIKLTDFGISELSGADGFGVARGGTIGYMPPEQIRGEHLDERTDEWGLAAVLYEALTGENPFMAGTLDKAVNKIENADVAAPSLFRQDLDAGIDGPTLDALSPSMDIRFDTVAEFANAVMLYLGDPAAGHASFKESAAVADEAASGNEPLNLGLWDRIGLKGRNGIARVLCALSCGWMTWVASSVGGFPFNMLLTLTSGIAIGSLLAPQLGAILALICLVIALVFAGAPVLAIILGAVSALWWFLLGRKRIMDAVLPFTAPMLSAVWLAPLYPLLDGFSVNVRRTAVATALGAFLSLIMCAATNATSLLSLNLTPAPSGTIMEDFMALISTPDTWVIMVGWVFAGILMAALCSRGSKVVSLIGSALGCIIMFAAMVIAGLLVNGFVLTMPSLASCATLGLAFIAMCAVTALGAPYHGEEESEEE